jgi:predicted Zn-dependent peptidase
MAGRPTLAPAGTVPAIPAVGTQRKLALPPVATRVLANGLTVMAVRQKRVPLVQLRLMVPTARARVNQNDQARQRVLGATLLSGTSSGTALDIARRLQELGGSLSAGADAEDLSLSGSALATHLGDLLALTAEVLADSTFPRSEVAIERDRVRQEVALQASQPSVQARLAVARRVFGPHPYGAGLPDPEVVGRVTTAQLTRYMHDRVGPGCAVLVLVGDIRAEQALDQAEAALGGWRASAPSEDLPAPPPIATGPLVLVDRPGAVQTNIRLAGPALPRSHPGYPPLALANIVFGGYFSSRLTHNLREDKGYTYSPHTMVEHHTAASVFTVAADVATGVTAPALVEIAYELGRLATLPVSAGELASAQRYLTGTLALAIQTQSGLASYLALLASFGLDLDYLRGLPAAVAKVTVDDVLEASARWLAPSALVTVMVGDASVIEQPLRRLTEVEVHPISP